MSTTQGIQWQTPVLNSGRLITGLKLTPPDSSAQSLKQIKASTLTTQY